MQIDINAITRGQSTVGTALAPELEELLMELKTQLGQKLEANVARVTLLTQTETQQLLAARAADQPSVGQKTLLTMLQDPNIRLVELAIRDRSVSTLTNLPLPVGTRVQVLVTSRGLLVLPPDIQGQQPSSPAGAFPTNRPPGLLTTGESMTPGMRSSNPTQLLGIPQPAIKNPLASVQSNLSVQKSQLASAVAQSLPVAQPLKILLRTMDAAVQELNKVSPQSSVPAPLAKLAETLTKITGLSIDPTNVKPEFLRQAMNTSGLFYEHRLLAEQATRGGKQEAQTQALPERDLKGLLIQLSQWAPPALLTTGPGAQATSGTLANLMMNLTRLLSPRQDTSKDAAASKQVVKLVQELAEKSLAQVQLQQYRTLSSQLQDTGAPAQWHLDIPLKMPDGYGNLYMHLFEPRLPIEEKTPGNKKAKRRESKGRWKVFLELELDHLGTLAAEIAVQEKTVEATLWTSNISLRERADTQLMQLRNELEQQGMVVADLRCSSNPPPDQKIRLDYALIDVKT